MRRVKSAIKRAGAMSRPAMVIMEICVVVSALCAAAALMMLVYAGGFSRYTYVLYSAAAEICAMPPALLLIGTIASACIEDAVTRKG